MARGRSLAAVSYADVSCLWGGTRLAPPPRRSGLRPTRWAWLRGAEPEDAERGQGDDGREGLVVPAAILRRELPHVPDAAAGVVRRVRIQQLDPVAARGQADAIALAWNRREVRDAHDLALPVLREPHEREAVVHRVVRLEPAEAVAREVDLPERRLVAIDRVEVAHEIPHPAVIGVLEEPPRKLALIRPLPRRRELAAHEDQLLPGVRPHERVERAQVRELLPAVARHLREQRALAVHDLVVRQRKDEVLVPRVDE